MDQDLKDKIHDSMGEHLTSKGWPDMTDDQIVQELPALWSKFSEEGHLDTLIKRGFTYEMFVKIALHEKGKCEPIDIVRSMGDHDLADILENLRRGGK